MKTLTYTVATDEMYSLADMTLPTFPKDTRVLRFHDRYQHPKYMFFALGSLAKRYADVDVLQYVDADIFMRGGNIFDRDLDCIWMLDEAAYRRDRYWADQFKTVMEQQIGKSVNWTSHWWNPGVSVIPRQFVKYFKMPDWNVNDPKYLWVTPSSKGKAIVKNMPYINWIIAEHGLPVRDLTPYWNCMNPLHSPIVAEANYWHITANEHSDIDDKVSILKRLLGKQGKWQPKACLVTVVIGSEFEEIAKHTIPRMEDAARRWNMDFKVIRRNKRYPSPSFCKLDYPEGYDVYVFADCDTIISKTCPNPVDQVPQGKFGAFNSLTLDYMSHPGAGWRISLDTYSERVGYALSNNLPFYINGGFFVCWNAAKHILDVPLIDLDNYYEQHGLNHNLWNDPHVYHELDHRWNWGHLHVPENLDTVGEAYIAHLNGVAMEKRIPVIEYVKTLI